MLQLDIIELIENNPITKLSNTYNNKLLCKIKENFTGLEQQLFITSFYCYLNYDKSIDFVVDLDNIWKWLGFKQKIDAKRLLEKHFIIDIDYKTALGETKAVLNKKNGGQNIKKYFLNIKCFKSLCLKAQTKKANEIHEYYMKMEDILYSTLEEETHELKLQLQQKDYVLEEIQENNNKEKLKLKKEKQRSVEQAIINQFPLNTECIYFGTIDNSNEDNEKLIKFGHTNNLGTRILDHRKQYDNFILIEAFRVQNKVEIENLIKSYPKIKRRIRTINVKEKVKTEIISYDDSSFTINLLSKYIKDIIHSKTYSIDNFNNLLKNNEKLENDLSLLRENYNNIKNENTKYILELNELKVIIDKQNKSLESHKNDDFNKDFNKDFNNNISQYPERNSDKDELTIRFDEFINSECVVRKDVEVDSCDIIAQFRIWNGIKPKRETNERFNTYLKTRFLATRLQNQDKDQCVHGFVGVMLKPIEYKKLNVNDITETFIFETCRFSPNNRIATTKLHDEYIRYKNKMGFDINNNELTDIKKYLNNNKYVLKGTLYIQEESFTHEGYYGLSLKTDNPSIRKTTSVTGKKVKKIDVNTGAIINNWDTIAKAAQFEKISPSKMSRSIKNNVVYNDFFYST